MSHFVYTDAGRAPRKIRNGTNDTGYSSLALNGTYEVSGGAALHQITDDGRTRAPRVRGLVPILVIAGASVIFTAASALLLYYNYVAYKPQEIIIQDPCEMMQCPQGAQCRVHDGLPVCNCIASCPQSQAQVCGTDGQTYINLCFLRRSACINNTKTGVQHPGPCVDLAGWYNPPSISEDDRAKIVAYVHQQERLPNVAREMLVTKRRMENIAGLEVKDSHDLEKEAKLKAIYEIKNTEWKDLMNVADPATSLSAPAKALLSGSIPTMPLISWMMALSNIGMGYASYVALSAIEVEEESLMPMFAYASQLALSWTVFPMLFAGSSFNFTIAHMGLSTLAALFTASMFFAIDDTAGYMMIPQVLVLGYASLHLVACGETEFKIRRTLTNLTKNYLRSSEEAPPERSPSGIPDPAFQ